MSRQRPRANTNTFNPPWNWKNKSKNINNNQPPSLPPQPQQYLITSILQALSPPHVPSPARARDLANAISHANQQLPSPATIAALVNIFCDPESLPSLQAAGYDVLAAYCEHSDTPTLLTSDRLAFFSVFIRSNPSWSQDLWEPRFKALRALSQFGALIAGFEGPFLDILKDWINAAFEPLLAARDPTDINERLDRERSIDVFASFLANVLDSDVSAPLVTDDQLVALLRFYESLVQRALDVPPFALPHTQHSPIIETSLGSSRTHRRGQSSASLPSLPSPTIPTPSALGYIFSAKHPADIACLLYLNFFSARRRLLAPHTLDTVLPLLFRAHAFYSSPLPRLAANPLPPAHTPGIDATMEERIAEALSQLLTGPYASTCSIILKRQLLPSSPVPSAVHWDLVCSAQVSLGALRTLRTQIRAALVQRLMRAYAPEDSNPIAHALNKKGPPIETGIARDVPVVARAVSAWTDVHKLPPEVRDEDSDIAWHALGKATERFMEEAAGLLRDVFQECDARADNEAAFDDDEAAAVGQTLYELAGFILSCRQWGTVPPLPLAQPNDAQSPFLRTFAALLAREYASPPPITDLSASTSSLGATADAEEQQPHRRTTNLTPRLSTTLLRLSPCLEDADTARLPPALLAQCALVPGDPAWLTNWDALLDAPAMAGITIDSLEPQGPLGYHGSSYQPRPLTRAAVMNVLRDVYADLKDMPRFRRPLVERVLKFGRQDIEACAYAAFVFPRNGIGGEGAPGDEVVWQVLADEVVLCIQEGDGAPTDEYLDLLFSVARGYAAAEDGGNETEDKPRGFEEDSAASETPTASASIMDAPLAFSLPPSSAVSPILSRLPSGYNQNRDKDPTTSPLPSVMSLLTSLAGSAAPSRSVSVSLSGAAQALHQHLGPDDEQPRPRYAQQKSAQRPVNVPRSVAATAALVSAFHQLAFMLPALAPGTAGLAGAPPETRASLSLAYVIYERLLNDVLAGNAGADSRARVAVLQFFMRVRADRDHRLEFVRGPEYDREGLVKMLAGLVGRTEVLGAEEDGDGANTRRSRTRTQERDLGRRGSSRGRGNATTTASSRSQSRVPPQQQQQPPPSLSSVSVPMPPSARSARSGVSTAAWGPPSSVDAVRPPERAWCVPEVLPFALAELPAMPSEALVSYDADGPDGARPVLPISRYLDTIVEILEHEADWEVLSYVLCHLPTQLANKHLFCGPRCRATISHLALLLARGILATEPGTGIGGAIEQWPPGLKARDARGLAFHALSVLVSYRQCYDTLTRHLLVEVFHAGLDSGQPATIECCLHALSLAAFELPSSLTKCLSRVLEKLAQIMSNPRMAVHILAFLSIVGADSCRALHANFTEAEYKMVFGVALQYLQHHNRIRARAKERETVEAAAIPEADDVGADDDDVDGEPGMSWALSQHVRILSYYVVYIWFLALRLVDRPRHVRFIIRQLLHANEGCDEVDEPTEVAFDWLSRYTYASADPRPTRSLLADIVMKPTRKVDDAEAAAFANQDSHHPAISEKTWLVGNAVMTIRTLERRGWIEVLTRRPSGFTKLLCRVENVPMVGPGDVDPDFISVAAGFCMERGPPVPLSSPTDDSSDSGNGGTARTPVDMSPTPNNDSEAPSKPDPITGYVWSGSAPSQRRKEVDIDPSFLLLQLSTYPDRRNPHEIRRIVPPALLPKFFNNLDRIPVIDTHKVGILYVSPGQTSESDILRNTHGSPAYTRFLEGLGRLINLRGQVDVYAGGLNPDEDGEYAYAWWDDIGQILYHVATMMPSDPNDPQLINKKRHIGNDFVRIVWNDSGLPYRFDTLTTQFQFVNIVIEPHSVGAIAAFSNSKHENEYFKLTIQCAPGMLEFAPVGHFKIISAESLPLLVRQLSLLADWFASVFERTQNDTARVEMRTNWHARLDIIHRLRAQLPTSDISEEPGHGILSQEVYRDFTIML